MRIDILTLHPELMYGPLSHSILKRAQDKNLVHIHLHNIRDYTTDKNQTADDYCFGGGAGMVMKIEPIAACIRALQAERTYDEIIYLTPEGRTLNQQIANGLSLKENMMMIAGHYKGIDQRVRDLFVTLEISIGDYVLSGGELPAVVLTDTIARLVPGVLNDETSALTDSFQEDLLAPPVYTRPADFEGHIVPSVLLSGNFKEIDAWRDAQALEKTRTLRPDLYKKYMDTL
jgi:tRNA (guanine37-N1)-methyltransferase